MHSASSLALVCKTLAEPGYPTSAVLSAGKTLCALGQEMKTVEVMLLAQLFAMVPAMQRAPHL
jgi:hypothetical protein